MKNKNNPSDSLYTVLSAVDETYGRIPQDMRLEIDRISQGLSEFGPRRLRRHGMGTEFFEARDFRPESDEPRWINARLSARAGRPVVIEKEAEIRQHVYLWRDASASMEYRSGKAPYTKKQAAEIMLLAFGKHLAKNEELIGFLDRRGMYRGGNASDKLASQLTDVTILSGDMPEVTRKLPQNSTVVLFGDFLAKPETIAMNLDRLTGMGLGGYMVMVLDPQEVEFDFRGHTEFNGLEGEGKKAFKKAEMVRDDYQQRMQAHVDMLQKICHAKQFTFLLQRTDEPLHKGLLAIYGLSPVMPERGFSPKI